MVALLVGENRSYARQYQYEHENTSSRKNGAHDKNARQQMMLCSRKRMRFSADDDDAFEMGVTHDLNQRPADRTESRKNPQRERAKVTAHRTSVAVGRCSSREH